MSETLALLVRHRVEDLAARTAEETIRGRIEGGEHLERLGREELWEFTFRAGSGCEKRIRKLTEESNLFVNPNKHHHRFTADVLSGREGGGYLLRVHNRDDLDGDVAFDTLVNQYDCEGLERVRFGTVWVIHVSAVKGERAAALTERFAVTRGPRDGLLVNPHYQDWTLEEIP